MLASKSLPEKFEMWNRKWGAPFGRNKKSIPYLKGSKFDIRRQGPFAFQSNNSTREFEYPWSYFAIRNLGENLEIVDIGGSLGGMQFVLSSEGHNVRNVDPGLKAEGLGWDVSRTHHERISQSLRANVPLICEPIQNAEIEPNSVDVVLCISSLEHFSPKDIRDAGSVISKILRPTGHLVITVDLFLNLEPFTKQQTNQYGCNVNILDWLDQSNLSLVEGNPSELYGFEEFSTESVLTNLANYNLGRGYPALAQCFIAKPTSK